MQDFFSSGGFLYVCVLSLVQDPNLLLVVCDKLFGPHGAAERAVPVLITRRQASGRVHWPGHTDTRTHGQKADASYGPIPVRINHIFASSENQLCLTFFFFHSSFLTFWLVPLPVSV